VQLLKNFIRALAMLMVFAAAACGAGAPAATPTPDTSVSLSTPIPNTPDPSAVAGSGTIDPLPTAPDVNNAPPTAPAQPTTGMPVSSSGVPIVARVNGSDITMPEFQQALTRKQLEVNAADPNALRNEVLDQLIEDQVVMQGAAAQQMAVTDADVQAELQSNIEIAGSEAAWQEWLTTNNYTADEFLNTLRVTLSTNRVRDSLTADLAGNVRQVHARHILLKTEVEANDVLARLRNGEDFAALAAALSNDEITGEQGGDLGWFTQDELLVPELGQAAFALQPGQIGGPVGTELGYHVIQTLEFADRPVTPERWPVIAQTRFENWLQSLMDAAVIERYL
jgi:peptidyl-prolyl cis-trans isomerase C